MRSSIAGVLSSTLTSIAAIARSGWFADRCAFASCCTTSKPLAGRHGAEQALEPRHGLRRLAALEVEPGERAQRLGRRRERDDAAMPGDRAFDLLGVVLGDAGVARPQLRRARQIAGGLEPLGLGLEQVGERAVLALARQEVRDRVDRCLVAGTIFEVRAQRVEPSSAFLDDADQLRELQTQLELAILIGLEAELDLAQRQQLGHAILDGEQVCEPLDHFQIVGLAHEHAAIHVDRGGVVAELDGRELRGTQAHVAARGLIERQARGLDQRVDRGAGSAAGAIEIDEPVDRPLGDGVDRARRPDRRSAAPCGGRTTEHGRQDLQRLLALAELGRDVGRTDERIQILAVGVGEPAQCVEQLRRSGGAGLVAFERDELLQPAEPLAAELERAAQRRDRRGLVFAPIAMQRGEPMVELRGDARRAACACRALAASAFARAILRVALLRDALEDRQQLVVECFAHARVAHDDARRRRPTCRAASRAMRTRAPARRLPGSVSATRKYASAACGVSLR